MIYSSVNGLVGLDIFRRDYFAVRYGTVLSLPSKIFQTYYFSFRRTDPALHHSAEVQRILAVKRAGQLSPRLHLPHSISTGASVAIPGVVDRQP